MPPVSSALRALQDDSTRGLVRAAAGEEIPDDSELGRGFGERARGGEGEAHGEELLPAPAADLLVAGQWVPVACSTLADLLPLHEQMMTVGARADHAREYGIPVATLARDPPFG